MLYDFGIGTVCWSEYGAIVESQRGLMAQYQEDCKLLLEEGSLCRGLEGYYQNPTEVAVQLDKRFQVYLSNFFAGRRTRGISETAQRPGGAECALGR